MIFNLENENLFKELIVCSNSINYQDRKKHVFTLLLNNIVVCDIQCTFRRLESLVYFLSQFDNAIMINNAIIYFDTICVDFIHYENRI